MSDHYRCCDTGTCNKQKKQLLVEVYGKAGEECGAARSENAH